MEGKARGIRNTENVRLASRLSSTGWKPASQAANLALINLQERSLWRIPEGDTINVLYQLSYLPMHWESGTRTHDHARYKRRNSSPHCQSDFISLERGHAKKGEPGQNCPVHKGGPGRNRTYESERVRPTPKYPKFSLSRVLMLESIRAWIRTMILAFKGRCPSVRRLG